MLNDLSAQIGISVSTYTELFNSPNESYKKQKSYGTGYNKSNFSYQGYGINLNYRVNKKISTELGLLKIHRRFDCDCLDAKINQLVEYYVTNTKTDLVLESQYNIFMLPISVKYIFSDNGKNIYHILGLGNTIVYSSERNTLIIGNVNTVKYQSSPVFISILSPDIYYQFNLNMFRNMSFNTTIGFRKESFINLNYALYGKLGFSYILTKIKK